MFDWFIVNVSGANKHQTGRVFLVFILWVTLLTDVSGRKLKIYYVVPVRTPTSSWKGERALILHV